MIKLSSRLPKGSDWDENGKTKIVQILISYGQDTVDSVQFVYAVDGKVFPSEMHGKPRGAKFNIVTFDYPEEYLVSLSGDHHSSGMASIAFGTNKRTYGPFGKMGKSQVNVFDKFDYNFTHRSSFGGFHGSVYSASIYGIGVYIRPLASLAEIEKDIGGDKEK